jgi:phosphonate transport system substrate-binding protein
LFQVDLCLLAHLGHRRAIIVRHPEIVYMSQRIKIMRLKLASLFLTAAALAGLTGCTKHETPVSDAAAPLKVGIIPFDKVDALKASFQQYADYLGKKSGRPSGEVYVTGNYAGILTALRADQIDCAYLNPLSYVLAVQEYKDTPEHLIPLAMPYFHGSLTYKGIIYVRADSNIHTIKDLKGKSFAFGDQTSTSGYLYPAGMMKAAGIDPKTDLKSVNIPGNAGVMLVYSKQADAGATYETGLETAFTDQVTKKPDMSKVNQFRVIAETDPIPNGMFVARGNLDATTLAKLQAALADINSDPAGQAALKAIPQGGWGKMVPADDKAFDSVRSKATILGLNLQSLDPKK